MSEETNIRNRYEIVDFAALKPVACPCGTARRAFADDPEKVASVHVVEIKKDSEVHYHKKLTETYYILEGEGHMELDGERIPVKPGTVIRIKPGCRHRAVGKLRILNLVVPTFDPHDEWAD